MTNNKWNVKQNLFNFLSGMICLALLSACGDMTFTVEGETRQDLRTRPAHSLHHLFECLDEYFLDPSLSNLSAVNHQLQMLSGVLSSHGHSFPIPASLTEAWLDDTIYPGDVDAVHVEDEIIIAWGDVDIYSGEHAFVLAMGDVRWRRMGEDTVVIANGDIDVVHGDNRGTSLVMSEVGFVDITFAGEMHFYTQGSYNVYEGYRLPSLFFAYY